MAHKTRFVDLSPVSSITSLVGDGKLVAFNVGPDGAVYLVIALQCLDHQIKRRGRTDHPKSVPNQLRRYRVVTLLEGRPTLDLLIEGERFNIHDIQPLVDEFLLVGIRSVCQGLEDVEKNGRVYTLEGVLAREILLGDGIELMQTTGRGSIWTSYSDEGILGGSRSQAAVGESGLVAWDAEGNKLYEFQPSDGLDYIDDCYALNVESDEDVWFYYYTAFSLVHLRGQEIRSFWNMPLMGSRAFAVSDGHALFAGCYKKRNLYHLFELGKEKIPNLLARIEFRNEAGAKLVADRLIGRADHIYMLCDGLLYQIDMRAVLA